jgi:hypothetical protein
MIAARAIALISCVLACVALARAGERDAARIEVAQSAPSGLNGKARLRADGVHGGDAVDVDVIAALGRTWDEPELRDLLAAFRIEAKPFGKRVDYTAFLQNRKRGIELTFKHAEWLDVRLREYPPDTLVLSNVRFYGPRSRTHDAFTGELPFGVRFGDSRETLIAKLGPANIGPNDLGVMRWDTARYALFATLDDDGTLFRLSLQTPYVASSRPGFEER